jgi:hypothetical protein
VSPVRVSPPRLQECPRPASTERRPPLFPLPVQEEARVGDSDEVAEEAGPVASARRLVPRSGGYRCEGGGGGAGNFLSGDPPGVAFPDQHHPHVARREPAQGRKAVPEDPARLREGDVGVRERLRQAEDDRDPRLRA